MCDWCFDLIKRYTTNFMPETEGKFFCRIECADSYTEDVRCMRNYNTMKAEIAAEGKK